MIVIDTALNYYWCFETKNSHDRIVKAKADLVKFIINKPK